MATLAELRKQTRCVHTLASEKIKTLSLSMERNFTWLSEILIEAKRSFASSELQLLPKTPSMKRKCQVRVQQRNIVDESSEEDAPPAKKKRNANRTRSSPKGKKVQVTDTSVLDASTADQSSTCSGRAKGARAGRPTRATRRRKAAETDEDSYADVDTPAMDVSTQSTRSTRASRKQTTDSENDRNSESASSNRSTRATRNTKAKTMAPPILKLQATRGRDNSDEDMEVDTIEEKQVRIKSDRDSIDRDSALASTTDSPKSSFCSVETGSQKAATEDRLDSFHKLSVKGKAQAYEELVKRASREDSGTECDTPETKTPMKENVPKTPNTVIAKQQTAMPRRPVPDETEPHSPAVSEMDTNEETPVRAAQPSTAEKARKARRSSRVSGLRTSMQRKRSSIANMKLQVALMQREMTVSQESESRDSPARPQREPPVRHESESTDSDLVAQTPEKKTRPARSKLRLKKSKPAEEATVSTSTEDEGFTSPKPHAKATRMTRSKMRPPPQVTATPESHSSEDNDKTPVVQGFSVPEEVPPCRSTRSKMRLPASSPKRGIQDNQKTGATPSKKQRCDESPKTPKAESDDEEWEDEQTPVQPARTRPKILKPLRAGLCLSGSAKKKPSNLCSVSSFLSRHNTPTHNTTITSFIARNASPKKISAKEQLLLKRKELEEKERAQLEKQQKKQELLKKRAEEQKRKREEKMLQVVQRRQEQEKREQEMLQGLVRKQEEKKTMTARMKEDKKREERERLRLRQVKMAEAEERRKQEEEQRLQKLKAQEEEQQRLEEMMRRKREFEERERQQKLAEQRRLEEERRLEAERERQREQLRLKQLEEQRAREEQQRQKEREERERREKEERERLEFEKLREKERLRQQELERQREQERQRYLQEKQQAAQEAAQREEERKARAALQKHNTSVNKPNTTLNMSAMKPTTKLNTTVTKDNSSESYIMTPQKKEIRQPICEENYDITNLRSDDSSEDEDNPKKKIPNWARGHALKAALLSQHDNPPDIIALFGHMVELDLNNLFEKKKSRFNKRTSSAIWTSPIMKP